MAIALPPEVEPLSKSGVVRGTGLAVGSGGLVAQNLPEPVTELERAGVSPPRETSRRATRDRLTFSRCLRSGGSGFGSRLPVHFSRPSPDFGCPSADSGCVAPPSPRA